MTLHGGEPLRLEPSGDLGARNAGLLVIAARDGQPEHVRWSDVARIDLDRPPASYPPAALDRAADRAAQADGELAESSTDAR